MKGYIHKIEETEDDELHYSLIRVVLTVSKKIDQKAKKLHIGTCELNQDEQRDDMHEPN